MIAFLKIPNSKPSREFCGSTEDCQEDILWEYK